MAPREIDDEPGTDEETGDLVFSDHDPCAPVCFCTAPLEWPFVTLTLLLFMLFVYYVMPSQGAALALTAPLPWERAWTLLTYPFAHGSAAHLWSNAFGLLWFGGYLELLDGPDVVVLVFFGACVVGACAEVLLSVAKGWVSPVGRPCVAYIGSSGGVYGLFGALVGYMLVNWSESFSAMRRLWGPNGPLGVRLLLLGLSLLLLAAELPPLLDPTFGGVANGAHLFGALFGVVASFGAGDNVVRRRWEGPLRWGAVAMSALALVVVLVLLGVRVGEWVGQGRERACFESR